MRRERLLGENQQPTLLQQLLEVALVDTFGSCIIILTIVLAAHALILLFWKKRANIRYHTWCMMGAPQLVVLHKGAGESLGINLGPQNRVARIDNASICAHLIAPNDTILLINGKRVHGEIAS